MSESRVLITGGTGLLGKALLETAPFGVRVFATHHRLPPPKEWRERFSQLDIRQQPAVEELLAEIKPKTVIHTASIGGVDEAEQDPDSVRRVNVEGTQNILRAAAKIGAAVIHISSNAVFDGSSPPYREDAPLKAINRYGQIKIEAERLVSSSSVPHLIVRPILMYGWPLEAGRGNAVTRWLKNLEKGRPVDVAEEIVSMPLWVGDCARTVWEGILKEREGIVHAAGADRVSLIRFAQEVCSAFGCDPGLVRPVQSKELAGLCAEARGGASSRAGLAPRPRDTSFQIDRMRREFGIEPLGIREGLTLMRGCRTVPCGSCS